MVAADAMMSGGDGQPETLAGVTVTLGGEHAMGETMETAEDGGFAFTGLRAGTYTVTISDFPEDISFETVSVEVEVEVGEVGSADFTGHFIRTSAVEGQVVIEGEGLAGVTVTLSGGPADESYTMLTDADGMYRFEELRPGDYTVSISDFDTRDYEFAATSQDVNVDLDETGTVSFTGVLLRTSGISGRVSVEGMGLDSIEVTLTSGDDSRTAMTDAGGQYSFAGLAAGDYTVSIAVDSDAYVFESMSSDVTVGDDESAIVNFDGQHARTASVSGMAFIDELDKNDMYDEGEAPLARAGLPVALVGPGVNEQRIGLTDDTGAFSFTGLRSGHYQLVVNVDMTVAAALAAADLAYGGPGTGYSINLGVGEAASQAIPFDITHTTVNFTVSLKHGDDMGAALPGASVTLYGANDARVGTGMTGEDGSVAIKVARAGTSGNMVMAGVSAEGYDVAEGMTDVSWNPQMFATAAGNSNDIVNLNVDATVSGATVTTDHGGGDALGGWALSVMSGGAAVAGAPAELDTAGNASFTAAVAKADLPVTYSFNVADDQDNSMDGGESFEGSAVEYMHTGLALAGTMDAGTIEVRYTTQTLRVYVHNERDQVFGFTGNIQGGDGGHNMNPGSAAIELTVEYQDGGRDHSFDSDEWDADMNTQYSSDRTVRGSNGEDVLIMGHRSTSRLVVFRHLPADKDIIVSASVMNGASYKVLDKDPHNDVLETFRNLESNGVMGGAFGAQGGYSSRVSLCPLQEKNPQNFDSCSSFAIVNTYTVTGDVSAVDVSMARSGDGFSVDTPDDPSFVRDITVSLTPKAGENFGGEKASFTTTRYNDDNETPDPRTAFEFEDVAGGVYSVGRPSGWGATAYEVEDGAATTTRSSVDPLAGDVHLAIRPSTYSFYGYVTTGDADPPETVPDVTVSVNGVSATSDEYGRYILKGVNRVYYYDDDERKRGFIFSASAEGQSAKADSMVASGFASANSPKMYDFHLTAAGKFATISGTVRASGSNAPVSGAKVEVDYGDGEGWVAPANPNAKSSRTLDANNIYLTGSDGTYSIQVTAKALGEFVSVRVTKRGMNFQPETRTHLPAHAGSSQPGIDFTGYLSATISGQVRAPGGGPLSGVEVTATSLVPESEPAATATTGRTGRFMLNVPSNNSYKVELTLTGHNFAYPARYPGGIVFAPEGQTVDIGTITSTTAGALSVMAARQRVPDDATTTATDESDPSRWGPDIMVTFTADSTDVPTGYNTATYVLQTNTSTDPTAAGHPWVAQTAATQTEREEHARTWTFASPSDGAFNVRVVATATDNTSVDPTPLDDLVITSGEDPVAAVDPSATGVKARRQAAADSDEAAATGNFIQASWTAVTNGSSDFRVVAQVDAAAFGGMVWVVLAVPTETDGTEREGVSADITGGIASASIAIPSGTGGTGAVTEDELAAAISIAVESVQGTADATADGPKWMRSAAFPLAARAASGG
ncbi:MAG: carboxypeptidase-like regulatory domain-containing protein [Gammaproteobacteria bacterium]|nr:carboxypeptidase-like regulatory domain-containing protein [Gammaproteobacteria bacterium]